MAIKLATQYPGRTVVDANNPNGTFKNSDPPGSLNGIPSDAAWGKDMWSFLEILMSLGGITHSGAPDDANASQRYDALVKIARNIWPEWDVSHTYDAGAFTIGSDANWYQSLIASNTGNDPTSSPTEWLNVIEYLDDLTRVAPRSWDAAFDYPIGALVFGSDSKIYKSLVTPNVGYDPMTPTPSQWREFVVDNVVSTFPDVALSANQGKLLQDQITTSLSPATKTTRGIVYLNGKRATLANNALDPVADIDFNGTLMSFDDGSGEALLPNYTKKIDAFWAAGDAVGGLDPASVLTLNTSYYCYAIYNPTSQLSDYVFTDTFGTVTVPGYTKKDYRGSVRVGSVSLLGFEQTKRRFNYSIYAPAVNYNPGIVPVSVPLPIPDQIPVTALVNVWAYVTGVTFDSTRYFRVYSDILTTTPPTPSAIDFDISVKQEVAGTVQWEYKNNVNMGILTDNGALKTLAITNNDGSNIKFIARGWIDEILEI